MYKLTGNPKLYWIRRYESDEHVYMECIFCKHKKHVVVETGKFISQLAKLHLTNEFKKIHVACTDPSVQLEMFNEKELA